MPILSVIIKKWETVLVIAMDREMQTTKVRFANPSIKKTYKINTTTSSADMVMSLSSNLKRRSSRLCPAHKET
jgi:hexokinase